MCDKESVQKVAFEWGSTVTKTKGRCLIDEGTWRTSIGGISRVRNALGKWFANGWLTGEKADQYFAALAKCGRAREAFLKPPSGKQRREIF